MHPARAVDAALALAGTGATATDISRALGIPRPTVRGWLAGALPRSHRSRACGRCGHEHNFGELPPEYAYLLGLYLGDGCVSAHARGVYRLRVVLDARYPGIIETTAGAMRRVRQGKVLVQPRPENCVEVSAYWRAWPCLFPQHGPGKKHHREIRLTEWQLALVNRAPEQLLRGLIQSDGCRFQSTGRNWSAPRYSFTNYSSDIRGIFCSACEKLGVRWTSAGRFTIYVSRKADVAILDSFIGPKR